MTDDLVFTTPNDHSIAPERKFRCSNGHEWKSATIGNPGQSFTFTFPDGRVRTIEGLCLFCIEAVADALLARLLASDEVGRVMEVPK